MSTDHAKPGDIIVIRTGPFSGTRLTIIEYPEEFLGDSDFPKLGECCWLIWNNDVAFYRDPTKYDIVKEVQNPDNTASPDTDAHLNQQRDANLRKLFT